MPRSEAARLTIYEAKLYLASDETAAGRRKIEPWEARQLADKPLNDATKDALEDLAARRKFFTGKDSING